MRKALSIQEKYPHLFIEEPKKKKEISAETEYNRRDNYFRQLEYEKHSKFVAFVFWWVIILGITLLTYLLSPAYIDINLNDLFPYLMITFLGYLSLSSFLSLIVEITFQSREYSELMNKWEIIKKQGVTMKDLFMRDISTYGISPSLITDISDHINTIQKTLSIFKSELLEKSKLLKSSRSIVYSNRKYFDLLESNEKWLYEYSKQFLSDLKNWLMYHQKELQTMKYEIEQVSKDADQLWATIMMKSAITMDSQIQNVEKVRIKI